VCSSDLEFGVKLLGTTDTVEPGASYPRIIAMQGDAPPQYPMLEEDEHEAGDWLDDELGPPQLVSLLFPDPELMAREWQVLVEAEREQIERVREFEDTDHYAPIARHFTDDPRRSGDAILEALLAHGRPDATWLDVGAGGGRYALPLALHSQSVLAVEPSEGMRAALESSMREHGIANVDVRPMRWPEEAGTLQADFGLMAHVGYDIAAIEPFVAALEDAARERCFAIMLERAPSVSFLELWEAVHDEPRIPLPGWREFVHYLLARGADPDVRMFPRTGPVMTPGDVRASARRRLWLKEGSRKDKHLQKLLDQRLKAGAVDFQLPTTIALISWEPLVDEASA